MSATYALTVPMSQFEALLEYESAWGGECDASHALYTQLANMGVTSEYDSHYSNIITVDIDYDVDDSGFRDEVATVISNQLTKAEKWKNLQESEKSC